MEKRSENMTKLIELKGINKTYKNGDQYQGQFVNGQFEGQGTFRSKTGWSYKGEFSKGQANGKGTLTTADGKKYSGRFKQGIYQK